MAGSNGVGKTWRFARMLSEEPKAFERMLQTSLLEVESDGHGRTWDG